MAEKEVLARLWSVKELAREWQGNRAKQRVTNG